MIPRIQYNSSKSDSVFWKSSTLQPHVSVPFSRDRQGGLNDTTILEMYAINILCLSLRYRPNLPSFLLVFSLCKIKILFETETEREHCEIEFLKYKPSAMKWTEKDYSLLLGS